MAAVLECDHSREREGDTGVAAGGEEKEGRALLVSLSTSTYTRDKRRGALQHTVACIKVSKQKIKE
jgi:hypothetical protein